MTVDESALRAEGYDDVAFCAPGCRTAFLADPDSYAATMAGTAASAAHESLGNPHGSGPSFETPVPQTGCCCGGNHGGQS